MNWVTILAQGMTINSGVVMLLTINGQPANFQLRSDSLANLLDDARAACPQEQLIISIAWNGVVLDESALLAKLEQPVADDVQIDLDTAPREAAVADALRAAAAELVAAADEQRAAGEALAAGNTTDGYRMIQHLPNLLQMCGQAVQQSAALLGRPLLSVELSGPSITDRLDQLQQQLTELRTALASRDTVSLSDLLEVELPQACESWAEALEALADAALETAPAR